MALNTRSRLPFCRQYFQIHFYTPHFNEVYWYHLVRLSVRPSVRLWTESCPLCIFKNTHHRSKILAIFLNLWLWLCLLLTWDPIWLNGMGNHEAAGVSSERRRSSCSSLEQKLDFQKHFIEIYCFGCNWQYVSFASDNGLAPKRRQAFIWTNDDLVHWRIYVSPDWKG